MALSFALSLDSTTNKREGVWQEQSTRCYSTRGLGLRFVCTRVQHGEIRRSQVSNINTLQKQNNQQQQQQKIKQKNVISTKFQELV
jgi:hypothetical protein